MKRLFLTALAPLIVSATPVPAAVQAPSGSGRAAWVAACADTDDWDAPGPPFRIHGNSCYVGTCGISAILVTGPRGHVLIDTGTAKGAEIVAANIRRAGFRLKDVKLLLHSHEHYDHVGGMARMQQLTGARLLASAEAAPVLASGRDSPGDPQAGLSPPFAPAKVYRRLTHGEVVRLGPIALTAHVTPGHTPGALSWSWRSCTRPRRDCKAIVFVDSLSPISSDSYRFSHHPAYVAAFREGLRHLAALPCDILIAPHPGANDLYGRIAEQTLSAPGQCIDYASRITTRLDARLAKEALPAP